MTEECDESFQKVKCSAVDITVSTAAGSQKYENLEEIEVEKSSFTTVFTLWNLLAGPSVLALPYAFYNSGLAVGIAITFLTYIASLRTCIYIKRTTFPDMDYFDTIRIFWGSKGYVFYSGAVVTLLTAANTGYFIIMT